MERPSRDSLLYLRPGLLHSLLLPVQWKTGRLRPRSVLVERDRSSAGPRTAVAFCARFPGAVGVSAEVSCKVCGRLRPRAHLTARACPRGHERAWFRTHDAFAYDPRPDRTEFSRRVLSHRRSGFPSELSPEPLRHPQAAAEMADGRHARRESSLCRVLHPSVRL